MTPEKKAAHEHAKLVKELKKLLDKFTPPQIEAALVEAEIIPAPVVPPVPPTPPAPNITPVTPQVEPPVTPPAPDVTPVTPPVPPANPVVSAAVPGESCYYVWNEKGDFVKSFHEDDYKGEAFKFAKELVDQHEGWTITL